MRLARHAVGIAGVAAMVLIIGCERQAGAEDRAAAAALPFADGAVEKLAHGYRFTEGPAVDGQGDVWFADIPNNRILRYSVARDEVTTEYEATGGANGLMFDAAGKLIACQGAARRLVRYDGDGGVTVLAHTYEGKRLNSPNDLAIDAKGGIYFTDPRYGKRDDLELDVEGVYYLDSHGILVRIAEKLTRPNGVVLSHDGGTLYVADHAARDILAYDVNTDGTLANPRVFAKVPGQAGGADGMTLDDKGNLYAACPQGIIIWNPKGEHLKTIQIPEKCTNCTFGGPERRDLYITAGGALYRIRGR